MAKKIVNRAKKGESITVSKNISEVEIKTDKVTFFSRFNCKIEDLAKVKFSAPENIKVLDISFNQIKDISLLVNFPNLERLNLSGNDDLRDFSVLDKLPNLQVFFFSFARLTGEEKESVILPKTFEDTGFNSRFVKITNTENNDSN